jgi:FkbM family methyltransferase
MTDFLNLVHHMGGKPIGLIQVGAHVGQEFTNYRDAALNPVLYVEPLPVIFDVLRDSIGDTPGHFAINALCAEADDMEVPFHVATNVGESSSMLEFGWHKDEYPDVQLAYTLTMKTVTVDTLVDRFAGANPSFARDRVNCLVIDTQGCELRVLHGSRRTLQHIDYLYLEVNEGGMYKGDCDLDDLMGFLRDYRFKLKCLSLNPHRWGNALFVKRP